MKISRSIESKIHTVTANSSIVIDHGPQISKGSEIVWNI